MNLIANQINNRLKLKFGGQPFLHTVNDGQLGIALSSLFEQTLSLVKKTGVLQCDAHGISYGDKQTDIGVVESVLVLRVFERDHAARLIAYKERHIHQRFIQHGSIDY